MHTPFSISPQKHKIREWIRVGEYEIYVHHVIDQVYRFKQDTKRIIYIEVEYRNQSMVENMSCRRNQWRLFSEDGYSYEPLNRLGNTAYFQDKPSIGGDCFINPGRNIRGWHAFDVPRDSKLQYLQFMNAFVRTKTADIEFENELEREPPIDLSTI